MKSIKKISIYASVFIMILLILPHKSFAKDAAYMDEAFRPQYHYTAEANQINDPNGLVYYDGEYHLFHQYNISGAVHWGHAVSTDLVHWTHLPPAIFPDEIGQIWSGSAVVDENNTSGLQSGNEKVMVALFTYSQPNGDQSQGLAYSNDKGRTWQKYVENPVMPNPGVKDFRDPKIFWHEESQQWIMLLVAGDHVNFFTSPDLIHWTYESEFGQNDGAHGGVWECPDLFPMAVNGDPANIRWVLSISVINGSPAGGTGMQYFIGDFVKENGHWTYKNANPPSQILWTNYGKDFYAGVTWNGAPDGRRLMIAWTDNWQYREVMPTTPFNGQLSSLHELMLQTGSEGVRMIQEPVKELESLRGAGARWSNKEIQPGSNLLKSYKGDAYELVAEFRSDTATASRFGFKVRTGSNQYTEVGYDKAAGSLYVDRNHSGKSTSIQFPGKQTAPMEAKDGVVQMRIFVDRSSVEVFGNNGERVITDLIFPDSDSQGMELFATGGNVTLNSLEWYPLSRVWGETPFTSTNLDGWKTLSGKWTDTMFGKEGSADGDGWILSSNFGQDFTYESDVQISRYKGTSAGSLIFRSDKTAEHAYVVNVDAKNDSVAVFKRGDGGGELAKHPMRIDTEKNYHLKVVAVGPDIKVYMDGQPIIDVQDSAYSGGYFGLNVYNSLTWFTNLYVHNEKSFETNLTGWDALQGEWSIGEKGYTGSSSGDAITLAAESGGDFTYEADISLAADTSASGLLFRSNGDATNAYIINFNAAEGRIALSKLGSGRGEIAKYEVPEGIISGKTYHLAVGAKGTRFIVSLNGQKVIQAEDSTYASGQLGLFGHNGSSTFNRVKYSTFTSNLTGWEASAGNWTDKMEGKRIASSGDAKLIASEKGADFTYSVDITSKNGTGAPGLLFRTNEDGSEGYAVNMYTPGDSISLFKFGNGGGEIAKYTSVVDLKANEIRNLKVITSGSTIKVYLDQQLVINASDTTYIDGQFGLLNWNEEAVFNNANLVLSNMTGWKTIKGSWNDIAGGIRGSASGGDAVALAEESGADFTYVADLSAGNGTGAPALIFRSNEDASQAYAVNMYVPESTVSFFKFGQGGGEIAKYQSSIPFQANTSYHLKVEASGSHFAVYLDGSLIMEANDSTYLSGNFGLLVYNDSGNFKNIIYNNQSNVATNLTGWTPLEGTWTDRIAGKEGSSPDQALILSNRTGSDFMYQANIRLTDDIGSAGLIFRSNSDASEGYSAEISADDNTVVLSRIGGNSGDIERVPVQAAIRKGNDYVLKVKTNGANIQVFLNDEQVIDVNENTYSSGKLGLIAEQGSALFNDIYAVNFATNLSGWHELQGNWKDTEDGAVGQSSGDAIMLSEDMGKDFIYEGDISISGTAGGGGAGALVFRSDKTASKAYVVNIDALNDVVTLFGFGPAGTIRRYQTAIDTDRVYHLKLVVYGTNIQVYLDGEKVINAKDVNYTNGFFGLLAWNSQVTINNVVVTPISETNMVTGITLNQQQLHMEIGDKQQLAAAISPEDATNQNVIWSSTNNKVAKVDGSGLVMAIGSGAAKIIGTTEDGSFTAECALTVAAPKEVKREAESASLYGGAKVARQYPNYTGTGYVDSLDSEEARVEFTIDAPKEGKHWIRLGYANATGRSQNANLYVNGDKLQSLAFPVTPRNDWSSWGSRVAVVQLIAGENRIAIGSDSRDGGDIHLDYLSLLMNAGQNLLENPGFENGNQKGWIIDNPDDAYTGVDSWDAYEGSYKHYFYKDTPYSASLSQYLSGLPDGNYRLSAYAKLSSDNGVPPEKAGVSVTQLVYGSDQDISLLDGFNQGYRQISTEFEVAQGEAKITFYVDTGDSTKISLQVDKVELLALSGGNTSPAFQHQSEVHATVNQTVTFSVYAEDREDAAVSYHSPDLPEGASLDSSTGLFQWAPKQAGSYPVTFVATDSDGAANQMVVVIQVDEKMPANTPPMFEPFEDMIKTLGETISFQLKSKDAEGDLIRYGMDTDVSRAKLDSNTGVFVWTPETTGQFSFTFTAVDTKQAQSRMTVKITVNAPDHQESGNTGGNSTNGNSSSSNQNVDSGRQKLEAGDIAGVAGNSVLVSLAADKSELFIPVDGASKLRDKDLIVTTKEGVSLTLNGNMLISKLSELGSGTPGAAVSLQIHRLAPDEMAAKALTASIPEMRSANLMIQMELSVVLDNGSVIPAGTFSQPVLLNMSYGDFAPSPNLLGVYYFNEQSKEWEYVGGNVDLAGKNLQVNLAHMSLYGLFAYDKVYKDISADHWAYKAIKTLSARHIVKGQGDDVFGVNKRTTRAEFASMLVRMLDLKAGEIPSPFKDMKSGDWFAADIATAYSAGLIQGRTTVSFAPNDTISRQEMAVILIRAYEMKSGRVSADSVKTYSDDAAISPWAKQAVYAAKQWGLMQGNASGEFSPEQASSRAESAQALYNWLMINS